MGSRAAVAGFSDLKVTGVLDVDSTALWRSADVQESFIPAIREIKVLSSFDLLTQGFVLCVYVTARETYTLWGDWPAWQGACTHDTPKGRSQGLLKSPSHDGPISHVTRMTQPRRTFCQS